MINIQHKHLWTPIRLRTGIGTAFVLAVLGLAGCGGGGGGSHASSSVQVQTVAPDSGPFIGGTTLTIKGSNFLLTETNEVKVGGNLATDVVVVDANTLTCKTPAGTPGATVAVQVTNKDGSGSRGGAFSYLSVAPAKSDVNGDGIADLIVAAPLDDSNGADSGAVFVFFGSDDPTKLQNRTTAQADLKIMGHHAGDCFGACICVGDVNGDRIDDLVVGANQTDGVGAVDAGAVYVFRGPLAASAPISALVANTRLVGEVTLAGDRFGTAIEVADLTGDGSADVVVGAAGHDVPGKVDAGCVYFFKGGATLSSKGAEAADMSFDGDSLNDSVGNRITCGDLNGDHLPDLVVCSQMSDPVLPPYLENGGKVFVLWGGSGLTTRALGTSDAVFYGTGAEDRFGASAAIADVNDDGTQDLIVGAPLNDSFDVDAGRVYVFFGGLNRTGCAASAADVVLSGLPTHNSFGRSIRTGDMNGDSIPDILIGAPDADYLNDRNGRAYVFLGGPGLTDHVAIEAAAIFNGESQEGDGLGSSVSMLDLNDDGFADVSCSSARHAGGAGRVYLWLGGNGTLAGQHLASASDIVYTGLEVGSQFGTQLAEGQ